VYPKNACAPRRGTSLRCFPLLVAVVLPGALFVVLIFVLLVTAGLGVAPSRALAVFLIQGKQFFPFLDQFFRSMAILRQARVDNGRRRGGIIVPMRVSITFGPRLL
jgi:hypothetical protein